MTRRWVWILPAILSVPPALYLWRTTLDIEHQSVIDESRAADVIVVLGAAEYHGKPSPVLRARLDHALELYRKGLSTRILTTGGAGGDPLYTESEVGRKYLSQHGVPVESIIIENEGESTVESGLRTAEIMRRMNLKSCIVVSDGYHIYRAKQILEAQGFKVYGSPRPWKQAPGVWENHWLSFRQAVGIMLWRLGIRI